MLGLGARKIIKNKEYGGKRHQTNYISYVQKYFYDTSL